METEILILGIPPFCESNINHNVTMMDCIMVICFGAGMLTTLIYFLDKWLQEDLKEALEKINNTNIHNTSKTNSHEKTITTYGLFDNRLYEKNGTSKRTNTNT